jgi:5-methyltetrahydrofolate--homocysteine methyltransferase
VTRPDVVEAIHAAYFEAGADAVETNTFGANLSALGEYDIADRIAELAEARVPASPAGRRRGVHARAAALGAGSMGPGTKLPSLGHIRLRRPARRLPACRPRR